MAKKPRPPTLETAKTVGERIVAARLAKGWNKSQLARALGVAWSTVNYWEKDEHAPDPESLRALSVVLGVQTSYLLLEDDATVTEPQYAAWRIFLETPAGKSMSADERRMLSSFRAGAIEVTPETYHGFLLTIRMQAKRAS